MQGHGQTKTASTATYSPLVQAGGHPFFAISHNEPAGRSTEHETYSATLQWTGGSGSYTGILPPQPPPPLRTRPRRSRPESYLTTNHEQLYQLTFKVTDSPSGHKTMSVTLTLAVAP